LDCEKPDAVSTKILCWDPFQRRITQKRTPVEQKLTRCSVRWQTSPPVPPRGEHDETDVLSLILSIGFVICKNDVKYIRIALQSEEDWATATGDMYRQLEVSF